MTEIFKKQAQLFIDAFPDVGRKSPVISAGGKIDFINRPSRYPLRKSLDFSGVAAEKARSTLRSIDFPSVADAEDQAVVFHEGINHPVISHT